MKLFVPLWFLFMLPVVLNIENTDHLEESTTEACGNSTEDSCEAFNNTDLSTTAGPEDVAETTKEPRPNKSTPKPTTKKPSVVTNSTKPQQPDPHCTCDVFVSNSNY